MILLPTVLALASGQAFTGDYLGGPFDHIKTDLKGQARPPGPPQNQLTTLLGLIEAERNNRDDLSAFVTVGAKRFTEVRDQSKQSIEQSEIKPGFLAQVKDCKPHYPRLLGPDYVRILWDCGVGKSIYVSWIKFEGSKIALMDTSNLVLPTVVMSGPPHG